MPGNASHTMPGNPISIPLDSLKNTLKHIQNSIDRDLLLPLEPSTANLATYYKISFSEASIYKTNLYISLSIPLVIANTFKLYKATSFPHKVSNSDLLYININI